MPKLLRTAPAMLAGILSAALVVVAAPAYAAPDTASALARDAAQSQQLNLVQKTIKNGSRKSDGVPSAGRILLGSNGYLDVSKSRVGAQEYKQQLHSDLVTDLHGYQKAYMQGIGVQYDFTDSGTQQQDYVWPAVLAYGIDKAGEPSVSVLQLDGPDRKRLTQGETYTMNLHLNEDQLWTVSYTLRDIRMVGTTLAVGLTITVDYDK